MTPIAKSVGKGGANRPVDVVKIQNLINNNDSYTKLTTPLAVTGVADTALNDAITAFQDNHPDLKTSDGRVDPRGKTLKALNQYNNAAKQCRSYYPLWFSKLRLEKNFDVTRFLKLYARQFPRHPLTGTRQSGLKTLLEALVADANLDNIRWAAYMLATVKHECANTWQPIEEYGKGAGRPYGKAVKVTDPASKQVYTNTYYGRGYVQLTWEDNYKKMDTALSLQGADSLHLHPEKALEAKTAYRIMSHGMRNGSFTGKKLSSYIVGTSADYFNARRIINGTDQALLIKGYAEELEFLLRFCNGK